MRIKYLYMKSIYIIFVFALLPVFLKAQIATTLPKSEIKQYKPGSLEIVNTFFFNSLDSLVFNDTSILHIADRYKYLSIIFTKGDSPHCFNINIILTYQPWHTQQRLLGYLEKEKYTYMIFGDAPDGILRKKPAKKTFKYIYAPISFNDDYLEWKITYNNHLLKLISFDYY